MRVPNAYLSKREQQILEVLYKFDRLTANEILEKMPQRVHNSTIRTQLRILEQKGHVKHEVISGMFFFMPAHERVNAATASMEGVIDSFFKGNHGQAVVAMITAFKGELSADDKAAIKSALG